MKATVFAPATVGNVGPGFDVLGLAVDGVGDRVTVELTDGPSQIVAVTGRDAEQLPREPGRNAAAIAALAMLSRLGSRLGVRVWIEKGVPLAGGMGGSASSSVGGALAARLALRAAGGAPPPGDRPPLVAAEPGSPPAHTARPIPPPSRPMDVRDSDAPRFLVSGELADLMYAALAGESAVAGRHLDNLAPCIMGGMALVRSVEPLDVIPVPVKADWWLALVSPAVRIETRTARAVLADSWDTHSWVGQMANTAALVWAFASGDADLVRRSLIDDYAEPRRARLIPHFADVKQAALDAGALACTISGAGPTMFAIAAEEGTAQACGEAMRAAFRNTPATVHVGRIARQGARAE